MNTKNIKILLIIPAYNEQECILDTYNTIKNYNKKHNSNYDVIVVNDGSTDDTLKILRANNIPHLSLRKNLGIGGAVQAGYKYAAKKNYDIAVQYDGDGQHDVSCVAQVTKDIINGESDMVIGSRFVDKDSSEFKSSELRRIGINIISFAIKLFTGTTIKDTTSGFRAINKDAITIFANNYPHEYPEPVSTTKLLKMKKKVSEVPVSMNERSGGVSSIRAHKSIYYMINVVFSVFIEAIGGYKYES